MTDNPVQNFGLRYNEFTELVDMLKNGNETLFERVFVKHFPDCRSYLMRECSATADDAYDITVETIIAFRQKLFEGKIDYGNLRFYFTKMAKDSYLKLVEKNKRTPVSEFVLTEADREDEPTQDFDDEQLEALDNAFSKLGDDCKNLLRSHVYEGFQLKQVAQQLGENEANIRKRKERCMDRLKTSFFEVYSL
jgi:RNA polymerase sigma factor (sigma-70 family)